MKPENPRFLVKRFHSSMEVTRSGKQQKLEIVKVVFVCRRDSIDVYKNSAALHIISEGSDRITYCSILIHRILEVHTVSDIPGNMCKKCQKSKSIKRS